MAQPNTIAALPLLPPTTSTKMKSKGVEHMPISPALPTTFQSVDSAEAGQQGRESESRPARKNLELVPVCDSTGLERADNISAEFGIGEPAHKDASYHLGTQESQKTHLGLKIGSQVMNW